MPSKTFGISADALVASSNLGAGAGSHLMMGRYSGYTFRSYLKFVLDWANVYKITSATLYLRNSNQNHAAYGGSPRADVYRCNSAWSEGTYSCESGYSAGNAIVYPGPGGTLINSSGALSNAENTWVAIGVSELIESWAPTTVKTRAGGACGGAANHGIMIKAQDESTGGDVLEWSSRSTSYDPYITLVYEDNQPPGAPTLSAPANGAYVSDTTPTLSFSAVDPDPGDTLGVYSLQVATDSGFVNKVWDIATQTIGISGWSVSRDYAGTALVPGTTYYWRANVRDASLYSPWSATRTFVLNRAPTVTFVTPNAADALCELVKGAGTNVNPRMVVRWAFADVDAGDSQSAYQVVVLTDAGGAFHDSGKVNGAASSYTVPVDVVRGAFYKVTVTVWDEADVSGGSGQRRTKANWGLAEYKFDTGAVPTNWSSSPASTAGSKQLVVLEYASSAAGGAIAAANWKSSLGNAGLNRWFHWRAWLFAWDGATTPSVTKMGLTYTSSVGVPPDGWTVTGSHSLDTSVRVYGTQSLKASNIGSVINASQLVQVEPNTDYVLSGRIKSDGDSGAYIGLSVAGTGAFLENTAAVGATQDFTAVKTGVWNSGANSSIYVRCRSNGAVGTFAWFDALKLEASTVVTPWTPGFVGQALTIDVGGIQVDRSAGAVMRMKGGAGGLRDTVELGNSGLVFGGDTELYSPGAGVLRLLPPVGAADLSVSGQPGSRSYVQVYLAGDAQGRVRVYGDATMQGLEFGDGASARDTNLYRSAANVLRTNDALTVDGVLTSTGLFRQGANAFPGSPVLGDIFYRNDRLMWFVYDGTRWLCSCLHTVMGQQTAFLTATTASQHRMPTPHNAWGGNIWVEDIALTGFVNTGGTALSASHKWGAQLRRATAAAAVSSIGSPAEIAAGAAGNWLESAVVAINNNVAVATYIVLEFDYVKTGTPGNIAGMVTMTYRNVG